MLVEVKERTTWKRGLRASTWIFRVLGLAVLAAMLYRLDLSQVWEMMQDADLLLVVLSIILIPPLILIKTYRWQGIMRSQEIYLRFTPALLVYFGSLFIGFITPGRLGELVKVVHVTRDCGVSSSRAFSGVLADRLFDVYALLVIGGAGLLALSTRGADKLEIGIAALLAVLPLVLFINARTFGWIQRIGSRLTGLGRTVFAAGSWLQDMRHSLRRLTWRQLLSGVVLTLIVTAIFLSQAYLLARALDVPASFDEVFYATALGSLASLVPISIAGLGTREATIVGYLGTVGVDAEVALTFSLLIFVAFYGATGVMGAIAWWVKPVSLASPVAEG